MVDWWRRVATLTLKNVFLGVMVVDSLRADAVDGAMDGFSDVMDADGGARVASMTLENTFTTLVNVSLVHEVVFVDVEVAFLALSIADA